MALIECEHFVDGLKGSGLDGDHLPRARRQLFIIGRIKELLIPPIAGASTGTLAAISALAEPSPNSLLQICRHVLVIAEVLMNILNNK